MNAIGCRGQWDVLKSVGGTSWYRKKSAWNDHVHHHHRKEWLALERGAKGYSAPTTDALDICVCCYNALYVSAFNQKTVSSQCNSWRLFIAFCRIRVMFIFQLFILIYLSVSLYYLSVLLWLNAVNWISQTVWEASKKRAVCNWTLVILWWLTFWWLNKCWMMLIYQMIGT